MYTFKAYATALLISALGVGTLSIVVFWVMFIVGLPLHMFPILALSLWTALTAPYAFLKVYDLAKTL